MTQEFIKKLQDATDQQFWKTPPEKATFQEVLDQYAIYYHSLRSPESQKKLSDIFWNQVKAIGTPIIEEGIDGKCEVYFLFRRDTLSDSDEKPEEKKDLYLQGDFHGYDTTTGRQLLSHFKNTGIMLRSDTIPRDAVITYRYVELEPSLKGKTPIEHHGSAVLDPVPESFFPQKEEIKEEVKAQTENPSDEFWGSSQLVDVCSTHRPSFFGIDSAEKIFRVNPEPSAAHLPGEKINWSMLLSTESPDNSHRKFIYHDTLYSDLQGNLLHAQGEAKYATPDQLRSTDDSSLYSQFTRVIHVFKPAHARVDNVVIVNDGTAYLLMGVMDHFETMVTEGKLSPHIAFVFINCLPALAKTVSALPPGASLPGMRERVVDYQLKIDAYADFIGKQLLPELDFKVPGPSHRVMIGSSLSGTATLYMALNRPDLNIGGFIVQSPSPFNRSILTTAVQQDDPTKPRAKIHLSCGEFEQPRYAANANWPYSVELSERLHIPLQAGEHGHQFVAWTLALEQSLPDITKQLQGSPRQSDALERHTFFATDRSKSVPDSSQTSQQENDNADYKKR